MKTSSSFKKMPAHLKPREKAFKIGVANLSDIELLAIIIRTGTKDKNVLGVASEVLDKFKSLSFIERSSFNELMRIKGIGKAKAIEIMSLFEFSKRLNKANIYKIRSHYDASLYASIFIKDWTRESFVVLVVDSNMKIIYCQLLYESHSGGINVDPKDVIAIVLKSGGNRFFCFHNHPSGNAAPSDDDILATERLTYLSELMGIKLIDHIILSKDKNNFSIKNKSYIIHMKE